MLMPGRVVLDTAGRCITLTRDYTVLINHWRNGGDLYTSGGVTTGATAVGNATVNQSSGYSSGITVNGTSGGMLFTISNITSYSISLKLFFSMLAGTTQVRVYSGADTTGVQLGSMNVNYTSPAAVLNLSGVTSPTNKNATITVAVSKAPGTGFYEHPTDLFSLDSIGYNYTTYGLEIGLFTQCNSLSDKYEFGYNGQMKMNEIAGIGNHNTALFWEYSPQIGRRWNRDPIEKGWESSYAAFSNNPIFYSDILGNISVPTPTTSSSDQCSDECSDQDGEGNKDKEDKKEEDKKEKKKEEAPNSSSNTTGGNSSSGTGGGGNKMSTGDQNAIKTAIAVPIPGLVTVPEVVIPAGAVTAGAAVVATATVVGGFYLFLKYAPPPELTPAGWQEDPNSACSTKVWTPQGFVSKPYVPTAEIIKLGNILYQLHLTKGGKQNLWDDQLSPLSDEALRRLKEEAIQTGAIELLRRIIKEEKRRGMRNKQKRNSK
jgi:hypothetical protein